MRAVARLRDGRRGILDNANLQQYWHRSVGPQYSVVWDSLRLRAAPHCGTA